VSSTKLRAVCLALACCAAALGCEKPQAPSPPPAAEPPAPKPAAESAASPTVAIAPVVEVAAVPVREDFEEEAERAITPANVEQQLDALEREVSAE
jgi:hypothetical protein